MLAWLNSYFSGVAGALPAAASQGMLWAVMTIGVFLSYRILDTADLTVEGSITLGGAVAARLITLEPAAMLQQITSPFWQRIASPVLACVTNPFGATLIAMLCGMLAGLVTALLHTKLKIPALISGILTMIALYSVNIRIMGRASISLIDTPKVFSFLERAGLSRHLASIAVGFVAVLLVTGTLYWFFGTEIGCAIRATGNNEKMARALGVHTENAKIIGLTLSNGLVALSGAMIAQQQSFADVQMGTGAIVIGLASLIIGEVVFFKGNFFVRMLSIAAGAVVYRAIIAAVIELGMQPTDLKLFTAVVVALALWLPSLRRGRIPKKRTVAAGGAPK